MTDTLIDINNLTIGFPVTDTFQEAVRNVNLEIKNGEIFALVGESGSGKTLISKSIMRLLPETAFIRSGKINFCGNNVLSFDDKMLQSFRGKKVGMVFQEPLTSLNPALKIGYQLSEGLKIHTDFSTKKIKQECIKMLERVLIPNPEEALKKYPHEFSGGMRQRIMLASVMLLKPDLLIADEPTTALDVIVQREVLDLMVEMIRQENIGLLLITHDLALVSEYADHIAVMEKGKIVETGLSERIIRKPSHLYTQKLFSSLPKNLLNSIPPSKDEQKSIVRAQNVEITFNISKGLLKPDEKFRAVKSVSLDISDGETVALVGESGSGKSTLGRSLLKLVEASAGEIYFKGDNINSATEKDIKNLRQNMQMIFQDPFSSLNPRMSISKIVGEPLRHIESLSNTQKQEMIHNTLNEVGLGQSFLNRFPHELSGGQRQRVCIARSIITKPDFIVADEPVAALDVTVQKQILDLFSDLQQKRGFSCLFISHDLAVVREISSRVMVMYHGYIVEEGKTNAVFSKPAHPYTRALLEAAPKLPNQKIREKHGGATKLPKHLQYLTIDYIRNDQKILENQFLYEISEHHKVAVLPIS